MLCVIFLLISSFTATYSTSDIYLYETQSSPSRNSDYFSFVLQDDQAHVLQKRQTTNVSGTQPVPPGDTPPVTNGTQANVTTSINLDDLNTEVHVLKPKVTILMSKNLGVNGTGIRKNITKDGISQSITLSKNGTSLQVGTAATNATITSNPVTNSSNQSEPVDNNDDLSINDFTDEAINKSLAQNNITRTANDTHQFYNSTLTDDPEIGQKYWVDMTNNSEVKVNELLSQSHRRAATVRLSFDFPFYGHIVRNITIATGGFLYTGEYVHSWLAATQYIAPLMANFDTSLSNDSFIKYIDNGTAFTVQWEKVSLQDKPNDGEFTFQTTLHINGDIVFAYQNIPIVIEQIQDDHHPVKVGLSDAYISDRTMFFVRRKTIYEYHRVNFNRQDIKNYTVIYLSALPTCLSNKDCVSCVSKPTSNFMCAWCTGINRCSSGMDRHRQDWLLRGCERKKIKIESMCSVMDTGVDLANVTADEPSSHYVPVIEPNQPDDPRQAPRITNEVDIMHAEKPARMGVSGIVTILFLITLVLGMSVWIMYAYRNPHSASGQILIRYRPSQWSWKRGEARYTAATIHM
ncbi:lethal (1) G0289 [Carabus blaptoides fortunei]